MNSDAQGLSKRRRRQLAKSELLLHLAITAQRWANEATDREPGILPMAEWPDRDHPLIVLLRTYDLTPADLARVLSEIGDELESRAERAGYADHLDPVLTTPNTPNV